MVNVTGSLDAIAVNDLINELRNAGAPRTDDVRLTTESVVTGAGRARLDGDPSPSRSLSWRF